MFHVVDSTLNREMWGLNNKLKRRPSGDAFHWPKVNSQLGSGAISPGPPAGLGLLAS
jgi:hypothetical protein